MPQTEDPVCITITDELRDLTTSYECFIFRVHNELRQVNKKAYEPNIIAIGPYHHGKEKLKLMDEHKSRYLRHILAGITRERFNSCVLCLRALQKEARRCYAEPFTLAEDEWVKMMILDGCFIIELVREFEELMSKYEERHSQDSNDPIFGKDWIVNALQRDLLLFENQLPFMVLCELFDMIEGPNNHQKLVHRVLKFFRILLPGQGRENEILGDLRRTYKHLLGVVHNNWLPLFSEDPCNTDAKFIHCVTELSEAGIKFKKGDDGSNLFDIKFKDGVLQIPVLTIEDRTEAVLRNLIAYEQCCEGRKFHFVSDYAIFVDGLINYPNDVRVLCHSGIIKNYLGDEEEVSAMFNKLTKSVIGSGKRFHYKGVFQKINVHYKKPENRWMAELRRNYFNSPWAIISVIAAILLLVMTFLQTFYTIKGV
ncbi:hypothetical protein LguiB_012647 [Lonicera macranthoides]